MSNTTLWLAAVAALGLAVPASAAVVVPSAGSSAFSLEFDDDGDLLLDVIDGQAVDDGFELTLAQAATVSFGLSDCCIPGDEYGLILDGVATAFTSVSFDVFGNFQGVFDATLAAGTYSINYEITELVGGLPAGATATFDVSPVPLPAAAPLLAVALGGLGLAARRRRAA